jgi:hypothetical protein
MLGEYELTDNDKVKVRNVTMADITKITGIGK